MSNSEEQTYSLSLVQLCGETIPGNGYTHVNEDPFLSLGSRVTVSRTDPTQAVLIINSQGPI